MKAGYELLERCSFLRLGKVVMRSLVRILSRGRGNSGSYRCEPRSRLTLYSRGRLSRGRVSRIRRSLYGWSYKRRAPRRLGLHDAEFFRNDMASRQIARARLPAGADEIRLRRPRTRLRLFLHRDRTARDNPARRMRNRGCRCSTRLDRHSRETQSAGCPRRSQRALRQRRAAHATKAVGRRIFRAAIGTDQIASCYKPS